MPYHIFNPVIDGAIVILMVSVVILMLQRIYENRKNFRVLTAQSQSMTQIAGLIGSLRKEVVAAVEEQRKDLENLNDKLIDGQQAIRADITNLYAQQDRSDAALRKMIRLVSQLSIPPAHNGMTPQIHEVTSRADPVKSSASDEAQGNGRDEESYGVDLHGDNLNMSQPITAHRAQRNDNSDIRPSKMADLFHLDRHPSRQDSDKLTMPDYQGSHAAKGPISCVTDENNVIFRTVNLGK